MVSASVAFTSPHSGFAQGSLDLEGATKAMSREIAAALKGLGKESLSIGQFTSPPQLAASGGSGIAKLLTDRLKEAGVTIKRRGEVGLKGAFRNKTDEKGRPLVEVLAELVDERGRVMLSFAQEVAATTAVASTLGLTFDAPADKPVKEQDKKIQESIEKPQVHIAETLVKATADSPYAVEILVNDGPEGTFFPHPAFEEEGLAFVDIPKERIYAVRLVNNSPHDAAVTLTIDGLSVFAFSENSDYKQFIIPAKSSGKILGWHRNNKVSDSFQVTEYAKSAAAELLPESTSLGTITASFAAAWPEDASPPDDELSARFASRGQGNATGRGPEVKSGFREVRRNVGRVRSSVSVRYDKS